MSFTLREVSDPESLKAIFALRLEAWKKQLPQATLADMSCDPLDGRSRHWAVFVDGTIVAAARLSVHFEPDDVPDAYLFKPFGVTFTPPVASLNRCVVHPSYRKQGIAKLLDNVRIEAAEAEHCKSLVAIRLTEKRAEDLRVLGFELVGHTVDKADGIFYDLDCYLMRRLLNS